MSDILMVRKLGIFYMVPIFSVLYCKREGDLELEGIELEVHGYGDIKVSTR